MTIKELVEQHEESQRRYDALRNATEQLKIEQSRAFAALQRAEQRIAEQLEDGFSYVLGDRVYTRRGPFIGVTALRKD